ncbi:hypothetical protein VTN49DRAFT_563 [Thermomyces lanuginosus]|uniref:uncharacterized protein n=1 Tax=Thermomyces lanuginosus TaxID=5541 RepID=UPI0037435C60
MSTVLRRTVLISNELVSRAVAANKPSSKHTAALSSINATATPSPSAIQQHQRAFQSSSSAQTHRHEDAAEKLIDRNQLDPRRSENTGSGSDDEAAHTAASFDPSNTAPEAQLDATRSEAREAGYTSSPLETSPANQEVNQARDPNERPSEQGEPRQPSSRGTPPKNKAVNEEKIRH